MPPKKWEVFQCWDWDSKLWQPVPLALLLPRKDTFSEAGTFYTPQSKSGAAKESPQKFWAPQHLYLSWICNWWKLNWTKCSKIRSVRSWNSFWYCIVWCFIISQKKTQSHQFIFFNSGTSRTKNCPKMAKNSGNPKFERTGQGLSILVVGFCH